MILWWMDVEGAPGGWSVFGEFIHDGGVFEGEYVVVVFCVESEFMLVAGFELGYNGVC